jgi:hypothetical protein
MYFTDRGIEELEDRRGDEEVTMSWLAERLRDFVDLNPEFEVPVDRLASWLARLDDDQDLLSRTGRGACLPGRSHGDLASGLGQDGCLVPVLVLRGLWCTAVTDDARPMPVHTMWMPRSCRQVCMVAASTSYGSGARVMPGAGVLGLVAGVVGPCAGVVGPCAGAVGPGAGRARAWCWRARAWCWRGGAWCWRGG